MTADDIITSSGRHPSYARVAPPTPTMLANAQVLAAAITGLLKDFGEDRKLTCGYRPPSVNARLDGAEHSTHLTCEGADVADSDRALWHWCAEDESRLVEWCLFLEDPSFDDDGHCHLQIRPTSKRIFRPR